MNFLAKSKGTEIDEGHFYFYFYFFSLRSLPFDLRIFDYLPTGQD